MKKLELRYYAKLRDERGCEEERVETEASTAAELYGELKVRHGFSMDAENLRVAINDEFDEWTATLNDGDRVVFIPPVAGG